jgi:hypothetical protein
MLALTARAKIQSPMLLLLTSSLSLSEVFVTAMTMMMRFCCLVRSTKKLELALDARNWKCFTKSPKYKEKALREKLLKKKKKKTAESSKFLCKCGRPKERAFGCLSFAHTTTEFLISELLSLLDCVYRHLLPGFFQRRCNHCNTVMIDSLLLLLLLLSSGATSP